MQTNFIQNALNFMVYNSMTMSPINKANQVKFWSSISSIKKLTCMYLSTKGSYLPLYFKSSLQMKFEKMKINKWTIVELKNWVKGRNPCPIIRSDSVQGKLDAKRPR